MFKIGLVDDSRSEAAAATAARFDFGWSVRRSAALAGSVRQHSGRGCCIAAARSRSRKARSSQAVFKPKPFGLFCLFPTCRQWNGSPLTRILATANVTHRAIWLVLSYQHAMKKLHLHCSVECNTILDSTSLNWGEIVRGGARFQPGATGGALPPPVEPPL